MEMRDRGLTGLGEIQAILEHYQMDLQNEVRRVLQDPICVEEAIACAEERIYSAASKAQPLPGRIGGCCRVGHPLPACENRCVRYRAPL